MRWIKASVGRELRLLSSDDVIYFQSDTKYTRVVLAQTRTQTVVSAVRFPDRASRAFHLSSISSARWVVAMIGPGGANLQ